LTWRAFLTPPEEDADDDEEDPLSMSSRSV
jgi:hypothetical protein